MCIQMFVWILFSFLLDINTQEWDWWVTQKVCVELYRKLPTKVCFLMLPLISVGKFSTISHQIFSLAHVIFLLSLGFQ